MAVTGDDAKLRQLMERLRRVARGDLGQQLRRELAAQTRSEIDRSFRERRSPDGSSWKPLRRADGGAPLVDSGALRSGFDVEVTDGGVRVRNHVAYANVHQRGGRIRRRRGRATKTKAKRRFGGGATVIPARPMVPTSRWGPAPEKRLRAISSRTVRRFFLSR